MAAYSDGDWWVGGFVLVEEDQRIFRLIEQVDKDTDDPAERMNYWRDFKDGDDFFATHVTMIEIHVVHVRPQDWETTDHRLILTERDGYVIWECRCGQKHSQVPYGDHTPYTVQEARVKAARAHDQHLVHEVPNLRCARCGERSHSIEYCERDA